MSQFHMMGSCGISKSLPEAMGYVKRAADRGDETAQLMFGNSCLGEERLRYLSLVAGNNVEAEYMLGQWWAEKEGSADECTERSIYWYTLASQGGDTRDQYESLEDLIGRSLDRYGAMSLPGYSPLPQAFYWSQKLARQGYPPAVEYLSTLKEECGDYCAVCCKRQPESRLRPCKCCGAAYNCGERCRSKHLEAGHKEDCFIPSAAQTLRVSRFCLG
jgi:TPR repeat protein